MLWSSTLVYNCKLHILTPTQGQCILNFVLLDRLSVRMEHQHFDWQKTFCTPSCPKNAEIFTKCCSLVSEVMIWDIIITGLPSYWGRIIQAQQESLLQNICFNLTMQVSRWDAGVANHCEESRNSPGQIRSSSS